MPPNKKSPPSITQNVSGDNNVVVGGDVTGNVVVGDNNTVNQTIIQKFFNIFKNDAEAARQRNRRAMLELVKETWIKGVLEKSLHNKVLIELGMEELPNAVNHPWDVQIQMPNKSNLTLPAGTSTINVFDEMNGAILILGEPGSGKTTMLLELARDSIERAKQEDDQPIPVIFNLSSWGDKQGIGDWLIGELNTKYNISQRLAQNWLENESILLLLDGLDEVKLENQEKCIKAINVFRRSYGPAIPIVVCSRIVDYEALNEKLNLSGAVLLQPLTPEQINKYFEQAGPGLDGVFQILKKDKLLQEMAKQPLILSIMILAYQGNTLAMLTDETTENIESRRRHLFDAYIEQMFKRVTRTKNNLYTPEQTKKWLRWLSQMMIEHEQTIFLPQKIHRSWLKTNFQEKLHRGILGLIIGINAGLVVGLICGIGSKIGLDVTNAFIVPLKLPAFPWIMGLISGLLMGISNGGSAATETDPEITNPVGLKEKFPFSGWPWDKVWGGLFGGWFFTLAISGLLFRYISLLSLVKFDPITTIYVWLATGNIAGIFLGGFIGIANGFIFQYDNFAAEEGYPLSQKIIFKTIEPMFGLSLVYQRYIYQYVLRILLYINGHAPLDYALFLDYAAERVFISKVGRGYIFIHRLILEHFATELPQEAAGNIQVAYVSQKDEKVYFCRGMIYSKAGEEEKAIENYTQAIQIAPKYLLAYYYRGISYGRLGEKMRSIQDFTRAIQINPKDAPAYFQRGIAFTETGGWKEAIKDFSQAIEIKPGNARFYVQRGIVFLGIGDNQKAVADLAQAIRIDPTDASMYNNLGVAYFRLGNCQAAVEEFNRAIQIDPEDGSAYSNRGNMLHILGENKQAVEDCSVAIQIDPKYFDAYLNRGLAYSDLGEEEKAIEDYTQAIQINSNHAGAYLNRGLSYSNLGKKDEAMADYTQAIQIDPQEAMAYNNRGAIYFRLGNNEKAIEEFTQAIQINPKYDSAYSNRGNAYYELGEKKLASRDFQKCAELTDDPELREYAEEKINKLSKI